MRGWKQTVRDVTHRKEFIAGGLANYATAEFKKAADRVGEMDADWNEVREQMLSRPSHWGILKQPLAHLPQVRPPLFCSALRVGLGSAYGGT